MAEFKKLSEVEQIETVSDNATVLVEDGGEIKRVPKSEVGGAAAVVIERGAVDENGPTFSCNTVTFEAMKESIVSGIPMYTVVRVSIPDAPAPTTLYHCLKTLYFPINIFFDGAPEIIQLSFDDMGYLYWTADGISANAPSDGK